ncbi:MAG: hypothetical protein GY792_34675 [Gammaproteobacteria bacterium]|nr:hypothetical protein [Gammaproteobacteria bacterium]
MPLFQWRVTETGYLSKPTDQDGLLNAVGELISPLLDSANPSQATAAS